MEWNSHSPSISNRERSQKRIGRGISLPLTLAGTDFAKVASDVEADN